MFHRNRLIIPLMCLVLLFSVACTQSQMKQAAVSIRNFAVSLQAVQEGFERAHTAGFVSDQDYKNVQVVIGDVATAGREAITALRKTKSKPGALVALDAAIVSIDKLLQDGVLHVKNEQTKQTMTVLLLSLRGTVTTTQALLQ